MQRLAELCVRRPILSTVITLVMVVLGIFSLSRLNVSRYPDVKLPIITTITQFPGAAPEEIESDITRKIENAVGGIGGIDTLTSTSAEGFSIVVAQFVLEKDGNVAAQEVRDRIGAIPDLPAGIDAPRVLQFDPNQIPVAVVALSADRPVRDISEYADRVVRPQLEGTLGVAQVTLVGDRLRQINVLVDPRRLVARGVMIDALLNAIQPSVANDVAAQPFIVHTVDRLSDLARIRMASQAGRPVPLGDVARIEDGAAPPETAANINGTPAVLLYVQKQPGANTVSVVRDINDRLRTLQETLAPGYGLRVAWDQAEYVLASTHAVEEHLIVGSLFAALVVLVFLWDWRATVIAALAIPISLVSTFTLLALLHLSLNTFTLLALALVIGIVIDDAIVVLENIYRVIRDTGAPPFQAAIDGTREVGPAVMATTLSLIVVFLPLAFMSGIVGRFVSSFGWTMAFAIAVSLVVSFTLTPSLASRWLRPSRPARGAAPGETAKQGRRVMEHGYRWLLERSLQYRWVVVALSALILVSIVPLARWVNQNFLPVDDESQFEVAVQASAGSTLAATDALGTRIAADIRRLPAVAYTIVTAGDDPEHSPNKCTVFVRMVPINARSVTQQQVMQRVRTGIVPKYASVDVQAVVSDISDISGSAAPLEYVISGPDLAVLDRAARTAAAYLGTLPGVVDIRSSAAAGNSVEVKVSPTRTAGGGVGISNAANMLALLSRGIAVRQVEYAEAGQVYPIRISADVPEGATPEELLETPFLSSPGVTVPLGSVVDTRQLSGPREIEHFNGRRQVTVSANLLPDASLGGVAARLDAKMRSLRLPSVYHLGTSGIAEQVSKTKDAFTKAFTMAFVFMFLVLAAQFESWVDPVTILLSLPLTVPFALISIILLHGSLNPLTYLGILVLFGVVKKNAILQVDRANRLRSLGMEPRAAILNASLGRLRPILMTTIAFVAGMIPLAVSRGVGAATNQSISTAIIGGQMLSLLLTLVAIPVVYSLFADLERVPITTWMFRRRGTGIASAGTTVDPTPASWRRPSRRR
jgi:hydrophobic/amphiphilic exporter-1 (mainly G- bacteria), HAE1 family